MKVTQNPTPHSLPLDKASGTERTADRPVTGSESRAPQAAGTARSGATVEISDNARLMGRASEIAAATPDVRRDRVEALKKAINEGTYQVDSGAVADKLLEDHLSTDFGKNRL